MLLHTESEFQQTLFAIDLQNLERVTDTIEENIHISMAGGPEVW